MKIIMMTLALGLSAMAMKEGNPEEYSVFKGDAKTIQEYVNEMEHEASLSISEKLELEGTSEFIRITVPDVRPITPLQGDWKNAVEKALENLSAEAPKEENSKPKEENIKKALVKLKQKIYNRLHPMTEKRREEKNKTNEISQNLMKKIKEIQNNNEKNLIKLAAPKKQVEIKPKANAEAEKNRKFRNIDRNDPYYKEINDQNLKRYDAEYERYKKCTNFPMKVKDWVKEKMKAERKVVQPRKKV